MQNKKMPSCSSKVVAFVGLVFGSSAALYSFLAVSGYQPVWPLPGLYRVEMIVASVIAFLVVFWEDWFSATKVWLMVGVLLAFVILGGWSVGPLFLPATWMFAIVRIGWNGRRAQDWLRSLGACAMAFVIQASLMVIVIRFAA